jgi:hypothetical protein
MVCKIGRFRVKSAESDRNRNLPNRFYPELLGRICFLIKNHWNYLELAEMACEIEFREVILTEIGSFISQFNQYSRIELYVFCCQIEGEMGQIGFDTIGREDGLDDGE